MARGVREAVGRRLFTEQRYVSGRVKAGIAVAVAVGLLAEATDQVVAGGIVLFLLCLGLLDRAIQDERRRGPR